MKTCILPIGHEKKMEQLKKSMTGNWRMVNPKNTPPKVGDRVLAEGKEMEVVEVVDLITSFQFRLKEIA